MSFRMRSDGQVRKIKPSLKKLSIQSPKRRINDSFDNRIQILTKSSNASVRNRSKMRRGHNLPSLDSKNVSIDAIKSIQLTHAINNSSKKKTNRSVIIIPSKSGVLKPNL